MKNPNGIIIAVDFDGTCVTHAFPHIGQEIGAAPILRLLARKGHHIILFTMRSNVIAPESNDPDIIAEPGDYLTQAVNWFQENRIPLWGINRNPEQHTWTSSPKPYANMYIDDAALGCPLLADERISPRPFVDWVKIHFYLIESGLL